jgi:ParB family chromosome partitioning protein
MLRREWKMNDRRQLGRGLGALIPSAPPIIAQRPPGDDGPTAPVLDLREQAATYREVPADRIRPNPQQPRKIFDDAAHEELVHSVREIGLLQPIVVRALPASGDADFEIVAGERRWRACRDAGLALIPVIVRQTSDAALLQEALLENLHRANLNPLEEGAAYNQLLHDFDCTQEHLAQRLGRSRPQIANSIRLLRLPIAVQRRVAAGVLSAGHARALLGLADPEEMEALAARIVAQGLSVRDVEEIVSLSGRQDGQRRRRRATQRQNAPAEYQAVADRLAERLETRVQVVPGAKKGRITIDFSDVVDLARIVEVLDGAQQMRAEH